MNNTKKQSKSNKQRGCYKASALSKSTRNVIYKSIEDFLRNNQIASINVYGEMVIGGSRIC
jgi:hypothetical protein